MAALVINAVVSHQVSEVVEFCPRTERVLNILR